MKIVLFLLLVISILAGITFGLIKLRIIPLEKHSPKKAHTVPTPHNESPRHSAPLPNPTIAPPRAENLALPALPKASETDPQAERNLARLTSIYEQMPPEDAGRILVKLPDSLLEKMLRRMDERQAGKILLTFDPHRAARLTQALAK
jgi:hypothetical protein